MRLHATLLNKVGELTKKFSNLPESYIKRSMEQVSTLAAISSMNLSIDDYLTMLLFSVTVGVLEDAAR